jgi:phospholipid/cholesterol/gamma-HCH transport system substrate-binding protein
MSERSQRIRLGLFLFGAFVVIAILIVLFAKQPEWILTSRTEYRAIFDNATGIQRGTPVRRSGVKIGEVTDIDLIEKADEARNIMPADVGKVIVTFKVDRKYAPRKSETAAITQGLLTGDSVMDIIPDPTKKPPDTNPWPSDQAMHGRSALSPREVGEKAQPLFDVTLETLARIRDTLERFARVAPDAENFLREYTALSRTLRETVPELQKTNDSVRALVEDTRSTIPEFRRTNEHAQLAFRNWGAAGERVNVFMQTNDQKMSRALDDLSLALQRATTTFDRANKVFSDENQKNLTEILENVKNASKDANQMMQDGSKAAKRINESADKFDKSMDNLQKATKPLADRTESIARNIEDTTVQIGQFVREVRILLNSYRNSDGTVQRLLTDPTLYNNANETLIRMSLLMPRLERIMQNLEVFADKIARHPSELGVRGAIKPDGGLKGSPFAPSNGPR